MLRALSSVLWTCGQTWLSMQGLACGLIMTLVLATCLPGLCKTDGTQLLKRRLMRLMQRVAASTHQHVN